MNKLASWLFPFIKTVLSISAAVPGFEPVHSWTITRTRTAAVSKLRKPRKDLERRAWLGSALPQPLKKHIQVPSGKINKHWSEHESLGRRTTGFLTGGEIPH